MIIDVNCFMGHWPFRKINTESPTSVIESAKKHNIDSMIISSTNAIFYQDPFEGDEEISGVIPENSFQALTINPLRPVSEDDIAEGMEKFNIKAVRLHPGYHGYRPCDKCVSRIFDILHELGLPVIMTYLMEDRRMTHMCMPQKIDTADIAAMIQDNKKIPVILTNIYPMHDDHLINALKEFGNLYFDTSGIKFGSLDVMNEVTKKIPADNIMYGSNYPLYCRESTLNYFKFDDVENADKILYKNAVKVFGL